MFYYFAGLRYSDVSALTWRNIKQVNSGLVVSIQTMQKTRKQVTIPLNQSALRWLPDKTAASRGKRSLT
ncbi:tyrosine-type recombinase/integrase [Bacteroides sp. 41_26]|uniref:tyrosine-type recombinase/integrase n=1 Tax=Bacteroides TaxID=816 RepID=UPI00338E1924